MPSSLATPVLSVSITDIAKVDTTNVDNLFTMWTSTLTSMARSYGVSANWCLLVFSKCADSLEHGRRLENLSWRLWNRETFCCGETVTKVEEEVGHQGTSSTIPAMGVKRDSEIFSDMPPLSGSVESVSSDCANSSSPQLDSLTNSIQIKPQLIRRDSSRGREKHMTPVHLAKLVDGMKFDNILTLKAQSVPPQKTQIVSAAPVQTSAPQPFTATSIHPTPAEEETHSIVRGFSPAHISSSVRLHKAQTEESKTKMWIIGSASSDGSASLEEAYRTEPSRKRTSFKEEVVSRTVYDDDDEEYTTEEEMDESAIDDDESDWDSVSESLPSSYEQRNMFQRREELAPPALPSRPSLLSALLGEPNRATALANAGLRPTPALHSRTTSPQGPSVAPSPSKDSPISLLGGLKIKARPVMTVANFHPPALSPRTTRRNMLATELTESLRQNLLWERKQQVTTAQALLKRRHTTHTEMSKLAEYPQLNHVPKDASKNNSWNHFFDGLNEYHTKGW